MAEIITMPRLSDTMTEGKVSKWHKKVGDSVKEGDILAEIETDKAVQDFESEINGTLLYIGTQEGEVADVDTVLAIIGNSGEDISSHIGGNSTDKTAVIEEKIIEIKQETAVSNEIPEGVEVITMPRLSDTMTEGKVAKWLKKVGDSVKEGDILAEIETDKAVQDFESEFDGTLLYIGTEEGTANVDTILAIIGKAGTDVSGIVSNNGITPIEKEEKKITQAAVQEETITVTSSTGGRIFISPLAKKLAEDKGYNLSQINGSGENGRIVKKDVENFKPSTQTSPKAAEVKPVVSAPVTFNIPVVQGVDSETPNSQMRTIIAKRLSESLFTAPHYYLMIELNMDQAIESRNVINSLPDTKISFNDMVIKATAMALRKHSQINSSWAGDKVVHHGNINIGVAVAVPDGLVVPVLKNTDFQSLTQISAGVRDLAGKAKNKGLKADEMSGSTFSISNLGMFGIESFTSIINQPNSGILSVGAIIEKPIVKNGQIVVGNIMKLSLALDHRVVDGATGAQFLQTLKSYIENPVNMLA